MARYIGIVHSRRSQQDTFKYLADVRSTSEWDPSIRQAILVNREPGLPGSRYLLQMLLRPVELTYATPELGDLARLVYQARTPTVTCTDTITIEPDATVRYDTHVQLNGWRNLLDLVLQVFLTHACNMARAGLEARLRN